MRSRKTGTRPSTSMAQKKSAHAARRNATHAAKRRRGEARIRSRATARQHNSAVRRCGMLARMRATVNSDFDLRERAQREERIALYDRLAPDRERWQKRNRTYYRNIERLVRFIVPEGASVLEIASGLGDLLASLKPSDGLAAGASPPLDALPRPPH